MRLPNQFMVVAFTEPQPEKRPVGSAWPQHLTIVPWLEGHRPQATYRIADAVAGFGPLRADIISERMMGSHNDVPVWVMGPCDILQRLYRQVHSAALKEDGTDWAADINPNRPYVPHITQKPGQPHHDVGDRLIFPELSVIGFHDVLGGIVFNNLTLDTNETAA